jgi:respiratory nitrate reductase gamma subunit
MSTGEALFFVILPYVSITVFVVGHWWRYKTDQFNWTSRSSQIFESKILGWAGPAFHYGALAAIGGHVVGILVPESFTHALGVSEHTYRWFSAVMGSIAGVVVVVGLAGLIYRRATSERVRGTTSRIDILTYVVIAVLIATGCLETIGRNLLDEFGGAYNYRETISPWFRSLFTLNPDVDAIAAAPFLFKFHATLAWALYVLWPFSRLVHAWSIPLQYLGRPYILYRRRFPRARATGAGGDFR